MKYLSLQIVKVKSTALAHDRPNACPVQSNCSLWRHHRMFEKFSRVPISVGTDVILWPTNCIYDQWLDGNWVSVRATVRPGEEPKPNYGTVLYPLAIDRRQWRHMTNSRYSFNFGAVLHRSWSCRLSAMFNVVPWRITAIRLNFFHQLRSSVL